MITQYDMTTGEIIADESAQSPALSYGMPTELRLMTVDEAIALERARPTSHSGLMPPPSPRDLGLK